MSYITIGSINIPVVWIALFTAVFYSHFRMQSKRSDTAKIMEQLFYLYIIIWKVSYVVFSLVDFLQEPLSLLYFDGGIKGHLLAIFVIVFVLYKKRNVLDWEDSWKYWARLLTVFQLIHTSFQVEWIVVILWGIILLLIERSKGDWLLLAQLFLLVWLDGFSSNLTILQFVVISCLFVKKKQLQHIAVAGLLSLVAIMVGDLDSKIEPTVRAVIDLSTTTGENYRLTKQEQSLTVVNFFATWCPPCKAEMPHLQSFSENLPENVELIGVNLTARDNGSEALIDFMHTYDVSYPILLDKTDVTGNAFNVLSIPTTVILNKQGEELERIVGPVSEDGLRKQIAKYNSLLAE